MNYPSCVNNSLKEKFAIINTLSGKENGIFTAETNGSGRYRMISFDQQQNELSLYLTKKKVGEGTYGEVFNAVRINGENRSFNKKVLKVSKINPEEIEREHQILAAIHKKSPRRGIQPPIDHTLGELDKSDKAKSAYLADKYDDNLFEKYQPTGGITSPQEAQKCLADLVIGLNHLHNLGYYHGDIKPENTACKDRDFFIADFGGVLNFRDQLEDLLKNTQNQGSEIYKPIGIAREFRAIYESYKSETKLKGPLSRSGIKRYFQLLKKPMIAHDIYSLGLTFYRTASWKSGRSLKVDRKVTDLIGEEKCKQLCLMIGENQDHQLKAFQKLVQLIKKEEEENMNLTDRFNQFSERKVY